MAVTILFPPSHGSVTVDGDDVVYTPDPGYNGPDTFQYEYSNGTETGTRNVCLTVRDVSDIETDTKWRAITPFCLKDGGGLNTGMQGWTTLEQYNVATGIGTGVTKPNSASDPDYVAPVSNNVDCPIGV